MKLEKLLRRLSDAGLELDASQLLDALWLAGHLNRELVGKHARRSARPRAGQSDVELIPLRQEPSVTSAREAPLPFPVRSSKQTPAEIFPNAFGASAPGRRAAGIKIHSSPSRVDRLALTRALRPFRTPWLKGGTMILDEAGTADATARAALAGSAPIQAVLRPSPERWFDVEIVVTDDRMMELWRDEQRAVVAALKSTGAFRRLRRWTLDPGPNQASLRSPAGGRVGVHAIGGERSLVILFTHGASPQWYSGVLDSALRILCSRSPTAVVQFLPRRWWSRTPLGEPDASIFSDQPGSSTAKARIVPAWWLDDLSTEAVATPVLSLDPQSLGQWARMVMTRGEAVAAHVLNPHPEQQADVEEPPRDYLERRLAGLREGEPRAFDLAVALSDYPFTIPVAKIVQEAHLGTRDINALAALFLSGLLEPVDAEAGEAGNWFRIRPEATSLLHRSLRRSDRRRIAEALVIRVSEHIAKVTGRAPDLTSFVADEGGGFALPDWARPYAKLAAEMRGSGRHAQTSKQFLSALRERASRQALGRLMRDVAHDRVLQRVRHGEIWDMLLASGVMPSTAEGGRKFTEDAEHVLRDWNRDNPLFGLRVLWVDDFPANNDAFLKMLLAEGAEVLEVKSTHEALQSTPEAFDAVISDMARREGKNEGVVLLDLLASRASAPPVLIFSGGFASNARNRTRARRHGALDCTNDFAVVHGHLLDIARAPERPLFGVGRKGEKRFRPSSDTRIAKDRALIVDLDNGQNPAATAGARAFATMLRQSWGVDPKRMEIIRHGGGYHDLLALVRSAASRALKTRNRQGTWYVYLCGGFALDGDYKSFLDVQALIEVLIAEPLSKQVVVIGDLGPHLNDRTRARGALNQGFRSPGLRPATFVAIGRSQTQEPSRSIDFTSPVPAFTREVLTIFEYSANTGVSATGEELIHMLSKRLDPINVRLQTLSDNTFVLSPSNISEAGSASEMALPYERTWAADPLASPKPSDLAPGDIDTTSVMGERVYRDLQYRFWMLSSSQRRTIALALGLLGDGDMALPEPERYGRALIRAGQRDLLGTLASEVAKLENQG